ncbi:MAG: helix-turn-helix domain-containing protein [Gemmatimonas sp.]|nr:helix-turn-helix domain-containing protein [Gemmatimonas sp.]
MQKVPRPLLVLHSDAVLRERLRFVARKEGMELDEFAEWDELLDAVRTSPASALIVVDPYAGSGKGPSIELSSLLNRFPSLTVIAAMAIGPGCGGDVLKLGQWGVVGVVDLEEEVTGPALGRRLMAARGRPLRGLVERQLPSYTSAAARAILGAATSIVAEGGQGADLARALHITPRTLSRWCRKAGLPPPKRLLAWMRILLAAEFLDDPGRSVTAVALACGYAADSSLRLALRRFTALNPTELRAMGAFETASATFAEALIEARAPKQRYRAPSRKGSENGGTVAAE